MDIIKAIIPAAGFGTRAKMRHNESKELLLHNGRPLIEYHLEICSIYKLTPHIITRREKQDLVDYLNKRGIQPQLLDTSEGSFANTVLKSETYWAENNVLLLPDTTFAPTTAIEQIKMGLELGNNAVIGVHNVDNISEWGQIKDYSLIDKPKQNGTGLAWGVIGFKKSYGHDLFTSTLSPNKPFKLSNTAFVSLTRFEDSTR